MKLIQIAKILKGQDGVVWKNELFRFDHLGNCSVYDLNQIKKGEVVGLLPFAQFVLDKVDIITPHNNATFWGKDYFCETDEFPLLYTSGIIFQNSKQFLVTFQINCTLVLFYTAITYLEKLVNLNSIPKIFFYM